VGQTLQGLETKAVQELCSERLATMTSSRQQFCYRAHLHKKPLLTVLIKLESGKMQYRMVGSGCGGGSGGGCGCGKEGVICDSGETFR
jgi:hypothetical protein